MNRKKKIETIFIFDIDGVITDPDTKKPNPFIITFIAEKLNNHCYLGVATGRSSAWVIENIVSRIEKKLDTKTNLDFLFLSSEKGTVTMTYINGKEKQHIDPTISIPAGIVDQIKKHVQKFNGVFFDSQKKTMVSIEIKGGSDKEKVTKEKKELGRIEKWLQEKFIAQSKKYVLDRSEIAVDLQLASVNKKLAAQKFLTFLESKNIHPTSFVMFGDSPLDALLAEEIQRRRHTITFVYVGHKLLEKVYTFPVIYPSKGKYFDKGVVEILQKKSYEH